MYGVVLHIHSSIIFTNMSDFSMRENVSVLLVVRHNIWYNCSIIIIIIFIITIVIAMYKPVVIKWNLTWWITVIVTSKMLTQHCCGNRIDVCWTEGKNNSPLWQWSSLKCLCCTGCLPIYWEVNSTWIFPSGGQEKSVHKKTWLGAIWFRSARLLCCDPRCK